MVFSEEVLLILYCNATVTRESKVKVSRFTNGRGPTLQDRKKINSNVSEKKED